MNIKSFFWSTTFLCVARTHIIPSHQRYFGVRNGARVVVIGKWYFRFGRIKS